MSKHRKKRTDAELIAGAERSRQIDALIEENHLTMTQVSYYLHCHPATLWRWRTSGMSAEQYLETLQAIAAAKTAQGVNKRR